MQTNSVESETACFQAERSVWELKTESIRDWAKESIDMLSEEVKEKQGRIEVLVKSCSEMSTENEKLREELRKNNARLMAYEKAMREEISRSEFLRTRVLELEAENNALLFEKYTTKDAESKDEMKSLLEENVELKKRVKMLEETSKDAERRKVEHEKITHELVALKREILNLNGIIDSINAEKECHARETTSVLSGLLKEGNESKILSKKLKSENKVLS